MDKCIRCKDEMQANTMSRFNTDIICLECDKDERLAPNYKKASTAEMDACRRGDYNFGGIGLAREDADFLAKRIAARAKSSK